MSFPAVSACWLVLSKPICSTCPPQSSLFHFPRLRSYYVRRYERYSTAWCFCRRGLSRCRAGPQVCGSKVREETDVQVHCSELRPFVITHFNSIIVTFRGRFRRVWMRPHTSSRRVGFPHCPALAQSHSAQSSCVFHEVRMTAFAHCGLRHSLNAWRKHIFEKPIDR